MTSSFILSGNIHFFCQNTYDSNQLTILTWYHQNTRCLDGHHTYVTPENDTNTFELQEVRHTLATKEARCLKYNQISIVSQQDYYLQSVILKKFRR